MKHATLLLSSFLVLSLAFACKSQKTTTGSAGPVATAEPGVYKGVTDAACALEVSFGSMGAGIDGATMNKVTALIDAKKLAFTSKNVGREGETRICLPLTELKGKEKDDFITQLKKIIKEGQMCSVSVR